MLRCSRYDQLISIIKKIYRFFVKRLLSNECYARKIGVVFGKDCRFIGNCEFGSEPYLIKLGDRVSLTNVSFVTHDGGVWVIRKKYPELDVIEGIELGDNVFVGLNSIVMPGVRVGSNVVIGAGSLVTKDIPDNSIACGIPARVIKNINQYEQAVLNKGVGTKGMSDQEKKETLMKMSSLSD